MKEKKHKKKKEEKQMEDNAITNLLSVLLVFMLIILGILIVVYVVLQSKAKKKEKQEVATQEETTKTKVEEKQTGYSKQSIFNFMEFDDVKDNMIIQKNGKRYIMVVECQGVNYDLMSSMEKVSVEEGFQQFLNTLRHPIQIYIQTRTVNLESSIETYKQKVKEIEDKYNKKEYELKKMEEAAYYSEEQIKDLEIEIAKLKNLLDYGKDIIRNTEKMSKNKNVLNKKYYVVIAYSADELGNNNYDKDELSGMAFSELYTKAQSLIRTLSACSVTGKILNSIELAELLYVAYNRDEAETYNLEKEIKGGVMELYSTSSDVFEQKLRILDKQIQDEAIDLANKNIEKAKSKIQQMAEDKEKQKKDLVKEMAKIILEENQDYIGENLAQEAIKELEKYLKEEEEKTKKKGKHKKENRSKSQKEVS